MGCLQALRGAGASYGIITSIKFQTHPAPSQPTNFNYQWDLSQKDFANALIKYRTFSYSDLPAPLGFEANLGKGSQKGRLSFSLTGGWYGDSSKFAAAVQPFLSSMVSLRSADFSPCQLLTLLTSYLDLVSLLPRVKQSRQWTGSLVYKA